MKNYDEFKAELNALSDQYNGQSLTFKKAKQFYDDMNMLAVRYRLSLKEVSTEMKKINYEKNLS